MPGPICLCLLLGYDNVTSLYFWPGELGGGVFEVLGDWWLVPVTGGHQCTLLSSLCTLQENRFIVFGHLHF